MPSFAYRTVSGSPGGGGGVIDAPDRASAVRELVRRGEAPSSLEEVARNGRTGIYVEAEHGAGMAAGPSHRGVASRTELATLVRELATGLRAGLPLVQSLKTIARQGRKERQKAMLRTLISEVEHGKPLSDAFAHWGPPFNELTINLTRAGEASGRLGEVLAHAADLLDRDVKLRRSLLSATLYPMILAGLLTISVIVIVTFIVPKILAQVGAQAVQLPWPTRVVQGFAGFFAHYWWGVLLAAGAAVLGVKSAYASAEGRMWIDERLLRVPLLGKMLRDVAVARFTRTLATLTAAGIAVVSALKVTKGTLGNRAMERVIEDVIAQVSAGKTIAEPMEQSGYFPPMLVQIVNMGERSGRLEELLQQAAGAFEDKTESSVKLFTTALPPILVVILAGVVGFVVLAILMALMAAQDAAMRG